MGWFVHMNGQGSGPYADADMVQMVAAGQVNETAHVCLEGTQTWLPVAQLKIPRFGGQHDYTTLC